MRAGIEPEVGLPAPLRRALLPRVPALDGLRGLAIAVVVAFHFVGHDYVTGGWAGVDIFFCLSGFLITALLLDEHRVHRGIGLGRFFARRALRLLPALVVFLAIWSMVLVAFHDTTWIAATPSSDGTGRPVDPAAAAVDIAWSLAYLANWDVIAGGMAAPLPHLWSLAVEEQFYLVWPALTIAGLWLTWRTRVTVLSLLVVLSAALPFVYWDGGTGFERIYFGSDTQAVALLIGALTAMLWHRRAQLGKTARLAPARAWVATGLLLAIAWHTPDPRTKSLVGAATVALATAQVIPHLVQGRGVLVRLFALAPLRWLGRRSYALYIWNYVWATWTHPLEPWLGIPLGVTASLLCTELSWRLVEAPALEYAKRFRVPTRAPRTPADPQPATVGADAAA